MTSSTKQSFNEKLLEYNIDIISINKKTKYSKENIKRHDRCIFKCIKCSLENEKCIRQILKTGFYCKDCTINNGLNKIGKRGWNKTKINTYFDCVIIIYNLSLIKVLNNYKFHIWTIPDRKWWNQYHSSFMGSLSKYNVLFQDLLKKYKRNTKRSRNSFKDNNTIIRYFKNVYNNEGIEGLIPCILDKNHLSIYSTYIYHTKRYEEDKNTLIQIGNSHIKGCPSYWICKRLNILDEREKYLSNITTRKTDNELIEIIKNQSFDKTQIQRNDYTNEMVVLQKRDGKKYNISYFRKLLGFPQNGYHSNDGKYILKSKAELIVYNMLLRYDIDIIYETPIYKNKKQSIDFTLILPDNSKIGMEIWMHSVDKLSTHKSKERYLQVRKEKENEQEQGIDGYVFYNIDFDKCYDKEILENIFENDLKLHKKTNYEHTCILPLGDTDKIIKELSDIYMEKGYISNELINSSLSHRLSRYHGGSTMANMCKILGINYNENYKKMNEYKQKKHKETKQNKMLDKAIEICRKVCEKIIPNKYGIKRINHKLFIELSESKCFHSKVFDGKLKNLFDLCKEKYPIYQDIIFTQENIWDISRKDEKYYLYSPEYKDFIENYIKFVNDEGKYNVPFNYINDKGIKLGEQTNRVRQNNKKNKIPQEYLNILNDNKFCWFTRKPNKQS